MAKGSRLPGRFLRGGGPGGPTERRLATVLFTDIVGSTELASRLGDRRWRALRDLHDRIVRRELKRFGGREMDTAGDGFFTVFSGPDQALACASAIVDALAETGIAIRAGVHTGLVEPSGEKVGGMAVHIGARIAAQAGPGEILVSNTVRDLISGSEMRFEDRGMHELKGVTGRWRLFVIDRPPPVVKPLPEESSAPPTPGRRRRQVIRPAVVVAALAGAVVAVLLVVRSEPETDTPPSSGPGFQQGIVRIDPDTNRVVSRIRIPRAGFGYLANPIAAGEGAVWAIGSDILFFGASTEPTLKINSATDAIVARLPVQGSGVAVGFERVWLAGGREGVVVVDPATNDVMKVPGTGGASEDPDPNDPVRPAEDPIGVAVGNGSVWITKGDGTVLRIDPDAQRVDRIFEVGIQTTGIAVGEEGEGIWVVDPVDGAVIRLDPRRGTVGARVTLNDATDVAIGEGSVWVTNGSADTVTQIDPDTESIIRTISVGDGPSAIAIGEGSVWVANSRDGTVSRIDPVSHEVEDIRVGGSPAGVAVDETGVWVAVYRNAYVG